MGFWVVIIGLALAAILLWIAYTLQSRAALIGAGVVVLLAMVIVVIDYRIVTDKEQVRASILRLASAVSNNDVDGVLAEVSPTADRCIADVRGEMPNYQFEFCSVRSFEPFEIDYDSSQPLATVEFRVLANVRVPSLSYGGNAPRVVELQYRKEADGRWYIYDYDHWSPPELERFTGPGVRREDLYQP